MMLLRRLFRRTSALAEFAWQQAGLVLVFLLLLDLICRLAAPLTYGQENYHAAISAYPQITWLRDYYTVYDRLSVRWHPYVYFVMGPMKSRYINIDEHGIRATWHPRRAALASRVKPIRIFIFGGSTMFGDNARDDFTIASLLAKGLAAQPGMAVEVTNFGQEGYSNTQEALLLSEQLRQGNIPDLAIFYDGVNDVATAFENRSPGLTFDELARSREFNLLNEDHRLKLSMLAAYSLARYSYGGLTAEWLADKLASGVSYRIRTRLANARFKAAGLRPAAQSPDAGLADSVVTVYLFNKHAVQTLADRFGFQCLFFWQPVIFEKKRLSPFERSVVEDEEREFPGHREFFRQSYARLREVSAKERIVDLSQVFADTEQSYYTDDAHLIEAGNEIVVKAMLPNVKEAVGKLISQPRPARSQANAANRCTAAYNHAGECS